MRFHLCKSEYENEFGWDVSGISSYDRLIKIGTDFNEFKSHVAAVVSEKNSNASALFVGSIWKWT